MRKVEEIVYKLRTTKSRSKRKLLDAAADLIEEMDEMLNRTQIAGDEMVLDCVLDEDAKMPERAHATDAGLDLFSREFAIVEGGGSYKFDTGVHIAIPAGYVGMVKAKSGLNTNHNITCTGVVDAGYTGSIAVKLYNHGTDNLIVDPGMKIAQLVILPIITPDLRVVNGMQKTDRGDNGFGSTGAY